MPEVIIEQLVSIAIMRSFPSTCIINQFLGDLEHLIVRDRHLLVTILLLLFLFFSCLFLELWWHILFETEIWFSMYFDELLSICNLLVFVQEGILRFPEFFLEYEFIGHEYLTSNDDIEEVKLTMVEFWVLVDISIEFPNFLLDFAHQRIIFAFLCFFIPCQVFIELVQQWEQSFTKLIQLLLHFYCHEHILTSQIDYWAIFCFRLILF